MSVRQPPWDSDRRGGGSWALPPRGPYPARGHGQGCTDFISYLLLHSMCVCLYMYKHGDECVSGDKRDEYGASVMKDYKKKGLRMRSVFPLGGLMTSTIWVLHQVSRKSCTVTGLTLRIA